MEMQQGIEEFLHAMRFELGSLILLQGDASTRRYFRVTNESTSIIICHDPALNPDTLERYTYRIVYDLLLSASVPVASVLGMDAKRGLIALEDLGDELLEDRCRSCHGRALFDLYARVLEVSVRIQSIRGKAFPFQLAFDTEKLMFEFNFFIEHALIGYFGAAVTPHDLDRLRGEFFAIAGKLQRPDLFVFTHRDFHARNIMYQKGSPFVIDFQDARMGLPQYDLVSLLRDCYVELPAALHHELKDFYYELARDAGVCLMGRDEFELYYDLSAFQRNIKAVGTFGYQVVQRNKRRFEPSIATALGYVPDYVARRKELGTAWEIIKAFLPNGGT